MRLLALFSPAASSSGENEKDCLEAHQELGSCGRGFILCSQDIMNAVQEGDIEAIKNATVRWGSRTLAQSGVWYQYRDFFCLALPDVQIYDKIRNM